MAGDRWADFIEWARRARAKPAFDLEEREYRLDVADAVRTLIAAACDGRPLRQRAAAVRERVMNAEVLLIPAGQAQHLVDWADRDEEGFAQGLRDFTAAGDDPEARLERFVAAIERGPGADRFIGGGLLVASLLNFAVSPERWPIAQPGRYGRLQELLGEGRVELRSAVEAYRRCIAFARKVESALRDAGVPIRDVIDVDSLITICSTEHELWAGGGDAADSRRAAEPDVYLAMCALFRNGAHNLPEWIEFHMLVGVERFFLYDNESEDDPLDVLAPYLEEGVVVRHEWPGSATENYFALNALQQRAYEHCVSTHRAEARWLAIIDTDEFLFSPTGRSIGDMLVEFERWPAVAVNYALFGTSGHVTPPEGLVVENYTERLETPTGQRAGRRFKSILDPTVVTRCDSPMKFEFTRGAAVDENGYPVVTSSTKSRSYERLRINHYFARSEEEVRAKHARRQSFMQVDPSSSEEWRRPLDFDAAVRAVSSGVRDQSIQIYLPALREALAQRARRRRADSDTVRR